MIDPKYRIETRDVEKFGIRQTHTITRIDTNGHRRVLRVFFGHDGKARAMNRYLFGEWEKHNHGWGRKRYSGRGTKVLDRRLEWWGIKEFPIHP